MISQAFQEISTTEEGIAVDSLIAGDKPEAFLEKIKYSNILPSYHFGYL